MTLALAHVVLSLDPGGTERLVAEMARRCARLMPTRVYCLDRAGEWAEPLAADGIPVDVVGRRPGLDLQVARKLRELSSAHRVDVLHCHQDTPFVYGSLSTLPRRSPRVVFTEHGRLSDASPSHRRWIANKMLARIPAAISAVSNELRAFMIAEGFPARRVEVIHNGISVGAPPAPGARARARADLGLSEGEFAIVTAARLDPVKDLKTSLDGFARLRRCTPTATFTVIGDGSEAGRLRAHAASLGIEQGVRWLGHRNDVRQLLPGFDAYLNSSISEGISVTILEAMAAGLPVVATAVGGTPEVVVHERTGLLVPSRDPGACAAALERLWHSRFVADQFGRAGRERVETAFTIERMMDRYFQLYRAA